MPGKIGVLTLRGDLKKSYDCDQEAIEYVTTSCVPERDQEELLVIEYGEKWYKQPVPVASIVWKFELAKNLVDPAELPTLPTRMR
jgi:hypothetical protein